MVFERFEYELLPDNSAEITKFTDENNNETIECVVIPGEVDGHVVTRIGDNAFREVYAPVLNIELPSTIKSIGVDAFRFMRNLISINLPEGLEKIEDRAFYGCYALASLTLPESLISIGNEAFDSCVEIENILIPSSVKKIGERVFNNCKKLMKINIPDTVTSFVDNPFGGCKMLEIDISTNHPSLKIDNGVLINYQKSSLIYYPPSKSEEKYTIPEGIKIIGGYAFYCCDSLKEISLPEGIDMIGDTAFYGCYRLEKINLPNSILHIGESAFGSCTGIEHITLPDALETLGERAFDRCKYLEEISVPYGVKVIGKYTFSGCEELSTVSLSKGTVNIADHAFNGCGQLKTLTFDNEPEDGNLIDNDYQGPKEIAEDAFRKCWNLTSITIPFGVQKIGDSAFYECGELTSVEIPDSVVEIGEWAFFRCEKLVKINLPNGLVGIDDFAFKGCSSLPEIAIPNSVETIGSRVFEECSKLKKANLPQGIKEVPYSMFDGCKKLKDISIPEGVTLIEGSAFSHCGSLTTLDIPTSVTSIGESAFAGTRKLVLRIPKNSHEKYCRMHDIKYEYYETDSALDSFVLVIRIGLKNGNIIKFIGEGGVKEGDREYHELFVSCAPSYCGECENIDELVKVLRTSVVQGMEQYFDTDDDPGDAAIFNEESPFIKEVRQIKSMDEIKTITFNGDVWSAGKHHYDHYTYYMDTKETVYDHGGDEIEIDEVGGDLHVMWFPTFVKCENMGQAKVEDHKGYDADLPMPAVKRTGWD